MRSGLAASAAMAALWMLAGTGASARPAIEAFASLPAISDPQLSPDGKQIAYIAPADGKPAVVIAKVGAVDDSNRIVIPSTDWIVTALRWVKNDHVMVIIRQAEKVRNLPFKIEYTRNISVPTDGKPMVMMLYRRRSFPYLNTTIPIADIDLDDPASVYMPSVDIDNNWYVRRTLLKADLSTGAAYQVPGSDPGGTGDWIMDGHGNIAARLTRTPDDKTTKVFARQGDSWNQVWSHSGPDEPETTSIYGLTEDGKNLVLASETAAAPTGLVKIDLASGASQPLLKNPSGTVSVIEDPWTSRIVGVGLTTDLRHDQYFSPSLQALQLGLEKGFPGKSVQIVSYDQPRDKLIVLVTGSGTVPAYYLIDRTTHQATRLASAYPGLQDSDLGQTTAYPYNARDGLDIHAYLTLPPGKPATNLPVVVMPHGGPEARDEIGFDWWVQFLANRGYAVLQPNYRGSAGYGRAFVEAGFREWGRRMQDDLADGVRKLVKDGIADPKRVCIVGASYGGYAALAGASLTPDVYSCAVSYAGVSDLMKLVTDTREITGVKSPSFEYVRRRVGDPVSGAEELRARSPVNFAAAVKIPVLLLHGEGDATVPVEHSRRMNEALLKAGKEVRFVTFKSEDHYMIEAATRLRVLQETEAFLYKSIGN